MREEHKLQVPESKVLTKIFISKKHVVRDLE